MANKLPPNPVGVPPGSSYWNDWYEKLRTLVDEVTQSTGTGNLVRQNNATIDTATINNPTIVTPGGAAISATVVLAKLTVAGTDGAAVFDSGVLISYTPPT